LWGRKSQFLKRDATHCGEENQRQGGGNKIKSLSIVYTPVIKQPKVLVLFLDGFGSTNDRLSYSYLSPLPIAHQLLFNIGRFTRLSDVVSLFIVYARARAARLGCTIFQQNKIPKSHTRHL